MSQPTIKRFRSYGFAPGDYQPGPRNLISDVAGVTVGHLSKTTPDGSRTGITVIDPSPDNIFRRPLAAAVHVGNGFGKAAGLSQLTEFGLLETPIALTNTHAVGPAVRGLVDLTVDRTPDIEPYASINAVVGETNDWILNRLHDHLITPADVTAAWKNRRPEFELGAVGAGSGTRAFSWKGGVGSSSRNVEIEGHNYTLGSLVQTNFGGSLTIMGVPVGKLLGAEDSYIFLGNQPDGSCMIIIATDMPLSSRQLGRIAKRSLFGLARTGSVMANSSGDYAIAFSTSHDHATRDTIPDAALNPAFIAAVEATEEAVYDAMFMATTTVGRDGNQLDGFPALQAVNILKERLS
jgi:D-aminopeptidase